MIAFKTLLLLICITAVTYGKLISVSLEDDNSDVPDEIVQY